MTFPTTISASQANKETPIGEMFVAVQWSALFGHDPANSSGLVFGVHGGVMLVDGVLTTISDQQTTLDASSTCYVEATRAGVISDNTSGFTAGRIPLYVVTTSASGVASFVEARAWHDLPGVLGRLSKSVAGSSNVTLTAAEARNDVLNFTGTLTGSINVIVPNGPQAWCVTNNTSGAFTLTVKTAAGTGVAVTQGKAADLIADGTNVVLSNNDAAAIGGALLAANNLSDLASAATARTNLGLAIGSNVQAYDAELAALAGLTSAADKGIQFTGSGTAATYDLTTAGKALLDDADAAAQRTTLGLGTAATLASDTDGTLAANSDSRLATQKAVKTYVDGIVTGGAADVMVFKGVIDCSANPNYPAADAGAVYKVSVAGKIGGASGPNVEAGDTLYCITDSTASGNHATVGAQWVIAQVNVDGAYFAGGTDVAVTDGGTGASTASGARTNLGLAIGSDVQAYDADLATIAGLTATTDNFLQAKSSAWASRTPAQVAVDLQSTGLVADMVGFRNVPANSQSAAYTTVAADSGKSIDHPSTDANARTFTIDSNANVPYPVGTCLSFSNMTSQVVTIAITSDTMYLAGTGATGSRSLAQYGTATARKLTSTTWLISGVGLT